MKKLVPYAGLWLFGVVLYFVTAPANITPMPVQMGWVVILGTIFSLIVLGIRFPMFGFFLVCFIEGLTSRRGGYYPYYYRRRRWW